jgi:hypothetical protein
VASEAAPCMVQRDWAEIDYGFDVCRVTKGGHLEHLSEVKRKEKKRKVKIWEFLFPSVGRLLPSFPPFKYTDFKKCVREL